MKVEDLTKNEILIIGAINEYYGSIYKPELLGFANKITEDEIESSLQTLEKKGIVTILNNNLITLHNDKINGEKMVNT